MRPSASVTPESMASPERVSSVTGMPSAGRPAEVSSTWVDKVLIRGSPPKRGPEERCAGGERFCGVGSWNGRLQTQQGDLAQVVDGLRPLGVVVVAQPSLELGQDLLAIAAGRADQEEVPEAFLVGQVADPQPLGGVRGALHAGLLAP